MKKKKYSHRVMLIVLGVFLFISIIVIIMSQQPSILSQSRAYAGIDNETLNQDAIKEPNITIFGSQVFEDKIEAAFELLNRCAPEDLAAADKFITGIYEDSNGSYSGAQIPFNSTNILLTSNFTKYLPSNYSSQAQIFWYAGAIVHEARHAWQFLQPGFVKNWSSRTPEETNAVEIDAINAQIATFKKCVDYIPVQNKDEAETILLKFTELKDKMQELKFSPDGTLI